MAKRRHSEVSADGEPAPKRVKPSVVDRLSKLSDELILRVLSFLPVSELVVCQRYVSSLLHVFAMSRHHAKLSDSPASTKRWQEMVSSGRSITITSSCGHARVGSLG